MCCLFIPAINKYVAVLLKRYLEWHVFWKQIVSFQVLISHIWVINTKVCALGSLWAAKRPSQESVCGGHSLDHEEVQAPDSRVEVEECKSLHWPSTWSIFYTTGPVKNFLETSSGEMNVPWQNLNGGQAAGVLCLLLYFPLGMFALHKCTVHPQPGLSCAAVPGGRLNWVLLKQQIFFNPGADRQSWILVHNN